jgi:hypothetical protein
VFLTNNLAPDTQRLRNFTLSLGATPYPNYYNGFFKNFDDSTTDFEHMMGPFYPVDRQTDDLLGEKIASTLDKAR